MFDLCEAAVASTGEMEGVIPGAKFPAFSRSGPATDEGVPVPVEESSAQCDDFSSSRTFYAAQAVCRGFAQLFAGRCIRHDPG